MCQIDEELKLIQNMRRRNPNANLVVSWVKLRQRGYTRSISGLSVSCAGSVV